ncbi:MAG: electron transfer flavoprotein subunit alpha/beta-like protein [Spirochaetes bacterium]|nr:MAG: electron transfer flavoprotein subunit alpha/beta-like protein [Spirochaetota bacterium]
MNILAAIKQVPDTDKVRMDPDSGTMIRAGVDTIVNPLDLYALEAALKLREEHGGTITVLTLGPPSAERALREALSMGCDAGVLVTDKAFAGSDTWATSYALSLAVKKLGGFDLILAGERATDGDTGQVGPGLAAWLDVPVATYVGSIESSGETEIVVRRLVEEGYQRLRLKLPCLATVVKEIGTPRLPTLRGKKFARSSMIRALNAKDLDAEEGFLGLRGSPTKVSKIFYPKVAREGVMLRAGDEAEAEKAADGLMAFLETRGLLAKGA